MKKRRLLFDSLESRLCMAAPTLQAAFNLPSSGSWTATPFRASPIMADVNNDGKDDLITVTAGAQMVAYGVQGDGTVVPIVTYKVPNGVADIKSTPIVVTDPRTGRKDIFAAMGRDESNSGSLEDGRVFGWDAQTGQLLSGWANGQSTGFNVNGQSGVYGPLVAGDLDGDGVPELVVTSFSHNVTAFHLDGSVMWQWTNDDTIVSGAVIGDIDRSGSPSVIIGGDSSNSSFYKAGGWVNVLSNNGILKWRKYIPGEVTWANPTLADLNNNGYLDIIIGTGLNYDTLGVAGARAAGNYLYAIDPFGNTLPGWPYHLTNNDSTAHQVLKSVAVGDLLGNGQLDVVAVDRAGYVHAIQPNGQDLPGFVGGKSLSPEVPASSTPDDYASPIIADVNGDGRPDIVAAGTIFVRAFDSSGNLIPIGQTNMVGGKFEGVDAAPVVGNMYGVANGTLAYVTYNAAANNRPDQVFIYKLPATTLTAPWASERRTASGDAVKRSPGFDREFVGKAFVGATGTLPPAVTLNAFYAALDNDTLSLTQTAYYAFTGPIARAATVQRIYQSLLGHAADANAVTVWSNYLAKYTQREMELMLIGGPEFASVSGNTLAGEVTRLYQAILGRTPAQSEVNAWVATGMSPVSIATTFFNGQEGLTHELNTMFTSIFGPGTQIYIPADTRAAFAYDYHRGAREEDIETHLLANNGNYAASNFSAEYIADIYRDLLSRQASSGEIAAWFPSLDNGSLTLNLIPGLILNSPEARTNFIQKEYQTLLGRGADPGALSSLLAYQSRESVILTLVGSSEYFNHNGGTISGYISAVFRDLAGINPTPQATINTWTSLFASGIPLIGLAQNIIYSTPLYFNNLAVNEIFQYLPDESLGVLRSANLSPTAAGQPINPSPALINALVGMSFQGASDEQIISTLLTTPDYIRRVGYYKGIWRSPGIRN